MRMMFAGHIIYRLQLISQLACKLMLAVDLSVVFVCWAAHSTRCWTRHVFTFVSYVRWRFKGKLI